MKQTIEGCCCCRNHLTSRELEVAALVAVGMSNQQIGHRMMLSRHTVGTHILTAMHRLGAHNRTELIARCYFAGLFEISTWPPRLTGRRCVPAPQDRRSEKPWTAP